VGIGGGFTKTIAEALAARCDCIQIFAGNPRGWRTTPYNPQAWAEFAKLRKQHNITPTVIHTSYLINLASENAAMRTLSAGHVAHDLDVAAKGKIEYVNTHLGSYGDQPREKGFALVCRLLKQLIKDAARGPMLLLENSAGSGNKCGGTIEELGRFLREVGSRRVGVCLDTAHLWASGYDISTPRGVESVMREIDTHIGFKRLPVLHLNDTEVPLGAKRDLHWHVGKGRIGNGGFRALLTRPELAHVACICETPKTAELDRRNVQTARTLAGLSAVAKAASSRKGAVAEI
jgi:deoxyribonuclease-4